jgi:hypothetical protein
MLLAGTSFLPIAVALAIYAIYLPVALCVGTRHVAAQEPVNAVVEQLLRMAYRAGFSCGPTPLFCRTPTPARTISRSR